MKAYLYTSPLALLFSLAKTLLTAFVALSLAAAASAQIRAKVVITTSGTHKTKTTETALYRVPYLEAGTHTVEVTVPGSVHFRETSVTSATDAQVINDVPNVTQNPLFYAIPQNGVRPRNETSTSTLGDL